MTFIVARVGQSGYHHITKMNKKVYKIRKVGEETQKAATEYDPTDDGITPMGGFTHYGVVHGDCIMIKGCCMIWSMEHCSCDIYSV